MERVVIKRRGGMIATQYEVWIGEQKVDGIVGYRVTEHYKMIPQVQLTVECSELIEELEFEDCELSFIVEKTDGEDKESETGGIVTQ